jgi:hypothetical protein
MPVAFSDLMQSRTVAGLKTQLIALCQSAGLPVTSWVPGDPSERWLDLTPRMVFSVLAGITTQAVRGLFLDLSTDPGDVGDLSADQTPRAGFLSALGEGWYGVTRRGQTYATTTVVLRNNGTAPATFAPYQLTFTTAPPGSGPSGGGEAAKSDGGRPTYRNTTDGSIYTGIGGTLTLAPGASSVPIPIQAEQIGSYGTASANAIICITQTYGTLATTASAMAVGLDRESADDYRARCRLAASRLSPGGPAAAYTYAATTARDGSPLQRWDGSGNVGVTRIYVARNGSAGTVDVYLADADGPADTVDVESASANMLGLALGVNSDPLGVVPDCITLGPDATTYSGQFASSTPRAAPAVATAITIVGTAKVRRVAGMSDAALAAAAKAAIETVAMPAYFASVPIGGFDQTAGAGVVPTADFVGVAYSAYSGVHGAVVTTPAGSSTAIAAGHVATLTSCTFTITVVP